MQPTLMVQGLSRLQRKDQSDMLIIHAFWDSASQPWQHMRITWEALKYPDTQTTPLSNYTQISESGAQTSGSFKAPQVIPVHTTVENHSSGLLEMSPVINYYLGSP